MSGVLALDFGDAGLVFTSSPPPAANRLARELGSGNVSGMHRGGNLAAAQFQS